MTDERFARIQALYDTDALHERHALIVGLGSGGSTVALELAKAGVGRLTLIDPDTIEVARTATIAYIPADVVLFGNQEMEGPFPRAYASALVRASPQEGCLVCGPLRGGFGEEDAATGESRLGSEAEGARR